MKSGIVIAAAAAAGLIATTAIASAHESRMGDAALGATAGMLVAGPVGLVAGGAIGYTYSTVTATTGTIAGTTIAIIVDRGRLNRRSGRPKPRDFGLSPYRSRADGISS